MKDSARNRTDIAGPTFHSKEPEHTTHYQGKGLDRMPSWRNHFEGSRIQWQEKIKFNHKIGNNEL